MTSQEENSFSLAIADRLKEERHRVGLSQTELGDVAGIAKLTQYNYETAKRDFGVNYLNKIKKAGIDTSYILTGERAANDLPSTSVSIPLYDVVAAAGSGCEVLDEAIAVRWDITEDVARHFRLHGNHLGGVQVKGDSMEPTLKDAGWVIFDGSDCDVERGGVFVIRCGSELRVKRVQPLMSGEFQLISDNKLYNPETIRIDDDSGDIAFVGRVVLHIGEMK